MRGENRSVVMQQSNLKYYLPMTAAIILLGLIMLDGCYFGKPKPRWVYAGQGRWFVQMAYTREPVLMRMFTESLNLCWGPE